MALVHTPSQTVGPFFNFGLTTDASLGKMAHDGAKGERILLSFRVTDGNGEATASDSMIELVPPARRSTLMARPIAEQPRTWHIDIRLQGEHETVFFDV